MIFAGSQLKRSYVRVCLVLDLNDFALLWGFFYFEFQFAFGKNHMLRQRGICISKNLQFFRTSLTRNMLETNFQSTASQSDEEIFFEKRCLVPCNIMRSFLKLRVDYLAKKKVDN